MTSTQLSRFVIASAVALTVSAAACSDSGSPTAPEPNSGSGGNAGPAGGASGSVSVGSLAIHLTDSPFSDAKALLVTFSGVSVHRADGDSWQTIPFASGSSRTCDLKKLAGPTDVLGVRLAPPARPISHRPPARRPTWTSPQAR
jgi:Domain of unknown function (DUF4382)